MSGAAGASAVSTNGIKTFLVIDLNTFFIKRKSFFINGTRSIPKNLPDSSVLDSWVFNNFILADEVFTKALQNLEACVLVNNILCGKLVSSF